MSESTKKTSTPMNDDELAAAMAKLKPGTRESVAFASIKHGRSRAAFRAIWLRDHLGVSCKPATDSKAVTEIGENGS